MIPRATKKEKKKKRERQKQVQSQMLTPTTVSYTDALGPEHRPCKMELDLQAREDAVSTYLEASFATHSESAVQFPPPPHTVLPLPLPGIAGNIRIRFSLLLLGGGGRGQLPFSLQRPEGRCPLLILR